MKMSTKWKEILFWKVDAVVSIRVQSTSSSTKLYIPV